MAQEPEDPQLERSTRSFRDSGGGIVLVGLAIAGVGGLIALLGALVSDWLVGVGAMVATLGAVVVAVGIVLLLIALVTNRMAHHRPFA
ncbi:hypothetical protein [Conexibacter arvalis]|uniref:Fatty acid desaturase n=1 Tax=Conexibacter arvalis TaxID=912552 RepID=A0A840IHW9_9ACTN|nr:hypothetical protein [Conexibacter arvalis]MBB4663548.1 fatty acid desaturase [Conexibacter arvalis]